MDNTSLIELRSKIKPLGTWVIRVTKEGIDYFSEGIITALANQFVFIPFHHITTVDVNTYLLGLQTDFRIVTTDGRTYEIKNVEKAAATDARELIYKLQKEFQANTQNSSSNHFDVADQIQKLANLKNAGLLTQQEFDNQKTKLLGL